jgi:carboxyl-terminal processing protease
MHKRDLRGLGAASSRFTKLAFFTATAFAGGMVGSIFSNGFAWATGAKESPYQTTQMMGRVLAQVENDYVDPVERSRLTEGAIKGMVAELDPHSSYMPKEDYAAFQQDTEGEFGGIGVEVDVRSEAITVINAIEGSPAAAAGVKHGDQIIAVDGEYVQNATFDNMLKKMRGAPGTHVKLTIKRGGTKDPITFDLVRQIIRVASVQSKMLDGGIAYIRLKQFQDHTHDELLKAAVNLKKSGNVTGVVLDMRSNPGGLVDEAADVADEFLSGGQIYTMRHRGQVVEESRARSGGAFSSVPIVLLVDEWSASAAELVAGALQDQGRAFVVGQNTFGKGSVQSIIDLPDGAGLRLTTARYYTPSGHAIQADGIHPNVLVKPAKEDPASAYPELRERDLEGHLAPEERAKAPLNQRIVTAPEKDDLQPKDISEIPSNPSSGPGAPKDFMLSIGYDALRGEIAAAAK